jgi:hypothetical protein
MVSSIARTVNGASLIDDEARTVTIPPTIRLQ